MATSRTVANLGLAHGVQRTDLDATRKAKCQDSIGLQHRMQRGRWSLALTKVLANFNTGPDVDFALGLGFER
jgi:hypothetical protein